jgi:hypothetical protein
MTAAPSRKNYLVLGLVALLFFGPMVAAMVMYFTGGTGFLPQGSVAHGTLLPSPKRLPGAPMTLPDGRTLSFEGRWALIYVDGGACDADCQDGLYRTRQVRRALGKENFRVQRVFVTTDGGQPDSQLLASQHPELALVDVRVPDREAVLASLGEYGPGDVFIADPMGNVVLRFAPGTAMKDMHKDLSHLLKASQIG